MWWQEMKPQNLAPVKKGDRVRLIMMNDPYSDPGEGTTGTVDCIDDIGTVHVLWDSGSRLGLIPGVDFWKVLDISTDDERPSGEACFIYEPVNLGELRSRFGNGYSVAYVIEDTVTLSPAAIKQFSDNLLDDVGFISERKHMMCVDQVAVWHCILVQSEDSGAEGILVLDDVYDRARYAAVLPESW